MIGDTVTAKQRLNPPSLFMRWCINFISELIWRYQLKCARFEYQKAKDARAFSIATEWMQHVENLEELLKRLGVDPREEPEDLTKSFDVYLFAGVLIAVLLFGFMVNLYRSALKDLLGG